LHDPDLLVLDEPTDGLDPVGRSEVRRVIEQLRDAGKTIFLNSHILQEVELVCTRVAIMAKGQIRGVGGIRELAGVERSNHVEFVVQATDQSDLQEVDVWSKLSACFDPPNLADITVDRLDNTVRFLVSVNLQNQEEIDRTVDQIRRAGLSICHLQIKRPTLEDTFIRLVGEAVDQPAITGDDGVNRITSAPTDDMLSAGSIT
jgi:ABC-2 type transport system ATP-binding protein